MRKNAEPERRKDAFFSAFADSVRRELLVKLSRRGDSTTTVEQVTQHLASQFEDLNAEQIRASLSHNHLPKLRDAGIVKYDRRSETIRYDGSDCVETVIRGCVTEPTCWSGVESTR